MIEHEWLLGLSGALAVVWIIAGYAVVFGVLLIWLGFRLKQQAGRAAWA